MCEVVRVKSQKLFPLICEIIKQNGIARITVTGMSMYPFLREGIDSVELTKTCLSGISRGDIVIIQRDNGQYVMHRVIKKLTSCFYIIGDAQQWVEGPLGPERLVAVVTAVWRGSKRIECTDLRWRLLSKLWLWLIPYRQIIIGICRRFHRVYKHFERDETIYEKKL